MTPRPCHLCGEATGLEPRFRKGNWTIVRCGACGLVYTNEVPAPAELDEIYGAAFFQVGRKFAGGPAGVGMVNAAARVDRLLAAGVERGRWLDVGCATGDFLDAARRAGITGIRGVELSAYAADEARSRGFEVESVDFADVALEPASLDVVTMWDYIEHVPDPRASLVLARRALRSGGRLAISTGDVSSLSARLAGRLWHLMIPPRHLYFFSPQTLGRLLEESGFSVESIEWPGKRVPLDFVAWKAAVMTVPPLAPVVLRAATALGLGHLRPTVNLGDIMTVRARAT